VKILIHIVGGLNWYIIRWFNIRIAVKYTNNKNRLLNFRGFTILKNINPEELWL